MKPEESIKIAIHCLGVQADQEVCEECSVYLEGGIACREVARVAISALEEIQQYREIGTVEECREAVKNYKSIVCSSAEKDSDGKCLGYGKSDIDDEPCKICKNCKESTGYLEGMENE